MATKRRGPFDPNTFLTEAGRGRTIHTYREGQVVFSQGDPADAIFYILKGQVRVTIVSRQGKEAVTSIHGTDSFFGHRCLVGEPHRIGTVTALADSVIMRLEKATFLRAIHGQSKFCTMFLTYLLDRHIRSETDLIDQLFNSSEKRLARLLVLLAKFETRGDPEPAVIRITQEVLAEKIGTTRARVSFFMNKFRRLGFVDYNGGIHVRRALLNKVLHGHPEIDI